MVEMNDYKESLFGGHFRNKEVIMRPGLFLIPIFLLIIFTPTTWAVTVYVPDNFPTIQAGIDACTDGDTVVVRNGTYTGDGNRDIDFKGKAIVVMSENGPEVTIIDCEGSGRGFNFVSGEVLTSVLKGFTITNGAEIFGGGIYCEDSSPSIIGNTITSNRASFSFYGGAGGGIFCANSSPLIISNIITGNNSGGFEGGTGGGICAEGGSPIIINNTITENTANYYGWGGGISCFNSSSTIEGNTISGNSAGIGGGIYSEESFPIITNSIVWSNTDNEIYYDGGIPVVTYSDIGGGWPGEGNIDADPMFVQSDTSMYTDYRLLWGSPCIDTGHPDSLDTDGTRSDMGAQYFNQNDYLTVYVTPDRTEVAPGEQLGVTYTLINRWSQSEPFWGLTQVILPGGNPFNLIGPDLFTLPANSTIQQHFNHNVPSAAPLGQYDYRAQIGLPPSTLYDEDRFTFTVNE
jgi:hypothetical protein